MSSLSQSYVMWIRPSRLNDFGRHSSKQRPDQLLTMSAKLQTSYIRPARRLPPTIAIIPA
jgi:hypothetical protein